MGAQFYATIQGSRGEASRTGTATSGIAGHVRGWDLGVRVSGRVEDGMDVFDVYITGGSNGSAMDRLIATVTDEALTKH